MSNHIELQFHDAVALEQRLPSLADRDFVGLLFSMSAFLESTSPHDFSREAWTRLTAQGAPTQTTGLEAVIERGFARSGGMS